MPKVFIYPAGQDVLSTDAGFIGSSGIDYFTEQEMPMRLKKRSQPSVTLGMAPPAKVLRYGTIALVDLVNESLR